MENINKKFSRDLCLIIGLAVISVFSWTEVWANLDPFFRENFSQIVNEQYHNTIKYSVDDETGWNFVEEDGEKKWTCTGGKCAEFQKKINCLFDDAFEKAVNQTNAEVETYTKEKIAELRETKIKDSDCKKITLENIQDEQEMNGFKTSCAGDFLSKPYSVCRVSETILNELGAYENFLLAKSKDAISFSRENFEHDDAQTRVLHDFRKAGQQYLREQKKSRDSVISTLLLYKDFVHNYRTHAWLMAVKTKLKKIAGKWSRIQNALETFPTKFLKASSVGG